MITLSCECGKRYQLKDDLAGKRAKCSCGKSLIIPSLTDLPKEHPTARPLVEGSPSAESKSIGRRRWSLYASIGVAIFCLVGTFVFISRKPGKHRIPSADDLPELWQRDWKTFADTVAGMDDINPETVEQAFGGRVVQWTGKLLFDPQSPNAMDQWPDVSVETEPNEVTSHNGQLWTFILELRATPEQWEVWAQHNINSQIVFRTELRDPLENKLCTVSEAKVLDGNEIVKRMNVLHLHSKGAQIVDAPNDRLRRKINKPDLQQLQGTWEITYSERNGKPGKGDTFEMVGNPTDVGGRYTFEESAIGFRTQKSNQEATSRLSVRSEKVPKEIDWLHDSDLLKQLGASGAMQFEGIYELNGDTLTWCYVTSTQGRPNEFKTSVNDGRTLWRLKKVSPNE